MRNLETDLDIFLGAEFSVPAEVQGKAIRVIFDRPYREVNEDGLFIANRKPALTAKSEDFANVEAGTEILVNGDLYEVLSIQPDGTGVSEVFLREVL